METSCEESHNKNIHRSRADPEQCCWGGARTVGGCELDGAKRLPRELRQGSGAQK